MQQGALFCICISLCLPAFAASKHAKPKRTWPNPDWQTSNPAAEGLSADKLDELKKYFGEHKSEEALVIRHGKIVAEWYWGDKTADSKIQAFSVTKSISSTAIGILVKDNKLSLDQKAADFVPD